MFMLRYTDHIYFNIHTEPNPIGACENGLLQYVRKTRQSLNCGDLEWIGILHFSTEISRQIDRERREISRLCERLCGEMIVDNVRKCLYA